MEGDFIRVSASILIPLSEIEISFTRSSGPGGQHVNKTSTQAELTFDLQHSPSIPEHDRAWLIGRLQSRIDSEGRIRITAQEYRSQLRNKTAALEKLEDMLIEAIKRPKKRKKTKPSKGAVTRRIEGKKKHGENKKLRGERF